MSQATLSDRPYVNSNLFSGHYLDERVSERDEWDCDTEAEEALEKLQSLYDLEGSLVEGYKEDPLIDNWIDEVLDILGFGTQVETTLPGGGGFVDVLLFEDDVTRRDTAEVYLKTESTTDLFEGGISIVEAKRWDADFTQRFSEQRPYRNASHQIKHYLERTSENIQWGVLTNGRKWRLYGTKDYETQTYYEVDLPELLEQGGLDAFKYFYVFFRPAAFRDSAGTTFLDTVWAESETAAQELGEDLQDNVFTALRVLGRGFVETNDFDIDPDDEDTLNELKDQSLVLLYRLMFLLYAEARGLIHPEGQKAKDEYEQNFSLDTLRQQIHDAIGEVDEGFEDEFSEYSTGMWSRLQDLFRLIDEGEESLGIPPYNGGLFNPEEHAFLSEHEVSNRYLAEVIYRLSTTPNDEGRFVLADYADLDTRHLGSVYEGLLEHQFRIAPEQYAAVAEDGGQVWKPATEVSVAEAVETVPEGGLYVVNDEGERKATGAYYTPDYVVTYIVEETVGPLIEEIREDLIDQGFEPGTQEYIGPFFRRVTDLRILDPAMGSGHFLTKTTGYLSEQVMAEVREAETEFGVAFDEQHIRREIAKECIYGVDLNGMAVELAKLSMWLETLAADRPLAFLDHHLMHGNSLVGSDVVDILGDDDEKAGQTELFDYMDQARQQALKHVMELMQDLISIDNETLDDIKEMERVYGEIRDDPQYQHLLHMINVHTAEQFGLDVPSGAYETIAKALKNDDWETVEDEDWYRSAQAIADEEAFFHWELEFPSVFYDKNGERRNDEGFDAVIGNPPWVDIKGLENPDVLFDLFETSFNRVNIYSAFCERATNLIRVNGKFGYITPNSYMTQSSYRPLRMHFIDNYEIERLVRLPDRVFSNVTMETAIIVSTKMENQEIQDDSLTAIIYDRESTVSQIPDSHAEVKDVNPSYWNRDGLIFDIFTSNEDRKVLNMLEESQFRIGDLFETSLGLTPYDKHQGHTKEQIENRVFHADEKETGNHHKLTSGSGIGRYRLSWEGGEWIEYGDWLGSEREKRFFTEPRCIVRQIVSTGGKYGINATFADETMFHTQVGFVLLPKDGDKQKAKNIVGLLNSRLLTFYHRKRYLDENKDTFQKILIQDAKEFPVPEGFTTDELTSKVEKIEELIEERERLNLNLLDYLGNFDSGERLPDNGFYQPVAESDSILHETAEDNDDHLRIRIGDVRVVREDDDTVLVEATARYRPDEDEDFVETEWKPTFRLTSLSETEADLVEAFVPVASEEGGGFAGFRKKATKTNSLIDRLKALTLPDPDDVADDLAHYLHAVERAEKLDEKIEKTDKLIDEIVYELYGLTDDEIEVVEEALADN
ncbi:Eco57I restriction-modification methylase domain-containing protein [Halomarina pelagica]|uniref:Eco57I restriction-modification methylase domain-containing protein n=1 Tax=Halomarina pelagica TaxID=2961599 RepID=UPI0020C29D27|nr:N-6 DNA methylase [Halomarina sp. BND7]